MNRPFVLHCLTGASAAALDVLLKNGVIVFAAFRGNLDPETLALVSALSWGLFMAPFFFLSAHGGYLGDHCNKRQISLALRGTDLGIAAIAAYGFMAGNIPLLLMLVFAKGITATLYSPVKYARIADLMPPAAQGTGYALLEAAGMLAILAGTYGGARLGANSEAAGIGIVALLIAGTSLLAARSGPAHPHRNSSRPALPANPIGPTLNILRQACRDRLALAAILALSWFWALGAVYLSNTAALVRDTLHGDESQTAALLVIFTVGMSLGLGGGTRLQRLPLAHHLPLAMAVLIAGMGIDLLFSIPQGAERMYLGLFVIALAAGIYATHFSSLLYRAARDNRHSRIFAANNIVSSLFMVVALALSAALQQLGVSLPAGLTAFAVATLPFTLAVGALKTSAQAPEAAPSQVQDSEGSHVDKMVEAIMVQRREAIEATQLDTRTE